MSDAKYIKQAIIATLCNHPEAEKYRARAFDNANIDKTMAAMVNYAPLTVEDFLTPDDHGRYIIDCPGTWQNFTRIRDIVRAGGGDFTCDDFIRPLTGERTLLASAVEHGGLGTLFTFDVWAGRFAEMERLWYRVPVPARRAVFPNADGMTAASLKRKLFEAEGKTVPEDRLLKAGLTQDDIRRALSWRGDLSDVTAKLAAAGDWLRKEYVLLHDASGDTCFDNAVAWKRYGDVVAGMAAQGERFEVIDFIEQVSFAKNLLSRAAEFSALPAVFTPAHWENRLDDMLQLWSLMLPGWRGAMTPKDFDHAYTEAESLTYASAFGARAVTGKADLLTPLNAAGEGRPVLPLGLSVVWDNFDKVDDALQAAGESLTLADLRQTSGEMGNTCLMAAAKAGHFAQVLSILAKSGEKLSLGDYSARDAHGHSLISILAEKNQLSLVFKPDVWADRLVEMRELWMQVPPAYRIQIDFAQLETATRTATLKGKGAAFKPKPKKNGSKPD